MTALILYFLLAMLVSFICSLLEAVLLSLSHAHIAILIDQGRKSGLILQAFKDKIDHPLSAILTLNTVANTVGAAGVGAQAQAVFGNNYVALFSGLLTFCILVFSEIIPKTIGAVYWKNLASSAAYMIRGLIYATYPLVISFEALGRLIAAKAPLSKMTRAEVGVAADMGGAEGALLDREHAIIKNLLRLNNIAAREVMTPRPVLFALPVTKTVEEVLSEYEAIRFSRIPVYNRDLDDITGLVRRFQINQAFSHGRRDATLEELSNPISIVPSTRSVADVLDDFIQKREHLFLVVDEYGGTAGIITLEDTIETLLGVEIVDELDSVEDMQKHALDQWAKRRNLFNEKD
jgi:CBS domain containing-hemolysin-like protein